MFESSRTLSSSKTEWSGMKRTMRIAWDSYSRGEREELNYCPVEAFLCLEKKYV